MIRRRLMVAWLLLAAGTEALRAPMHHPSPHRGSRRASAPVSAIWDRLRRTTPEGATEETAEEQSSEPRADGPTLLADEKAYSAKIAEAEAGNRVVVIKFYASWCRACKAMAPKFSRVAQDWPELEFCEILFDDNKALCKQLGIKVLPYIEIVAGNAGKVDGFSCGPSKISKLIERLEVYGGCEDEIPCTSVADQLDFVEI